MYWVLGPQALLTLNGCLGSADPYPLMGLPLAEVHPSWPPAWLPPGDRHLENILLPMGSAGQCGGPQFPACSRLEVCVALLVLLRSLCSGCCCFFLFSGGVFFFILSHAFVMRLDLLFTCLYLPSSRTSSLSDTVLFPILSIRPLYTPHPFPNPTPLLNLISKKTEGVY